MKYPDSIQHLIDNFQKLPGVGSKTAERMAFHVLKMDRDEVLDFSKSLAVLPDQITYCEECHHITEVTENPCPICSDEERDRTTICVLEQPKDVIALEKMRGYKGLYHVLHGVLSPMNGIGVEDIKIKSLIERLQKSNSIQEIIIATNPTMEGETTAMYISRLLNGTGIRVTRIAHGLPVGGDLEYADEITLSKAMEGRREI